MRIPEGWTQPKYGLGERTKQGMIIGIDYYPKGRLMSTVIYGVTW
jgi:hypothetical protein